jgi:hypothetical protein
METAEAEAQVFEEADDLPEDEGMELREAAKLVLFGVLAGFLVFILLGFIRYFWVKQYGG